MVAPGEVAIAVTPEITGTIALLTVIETLLVALLPAASLATAVSVWVPFAAAVVFQE